MRGCFVTGTDTGAGKTIVAAAIVAGLRARGTPVRAMKPILTGLDESPAEPWPHDHVVLAGAAGCAPGEVVVASYGPAVSPHLAAELAGEAIDPKEIVDAVKIAVREPAVPVVEGVGGLLVPIAPGYDVADLASELGLPLVVAARPGLGTINHTLLTLEAARARGLEVSGVVLTPWPSAPDVIERSNRAAIERLGGVAVATLPHIDGARPELLAAASRTLPIDDWLRLTG